MEWIQLAIRTSHDGIEPLCAALESIGVRGFEIEDSADFEAFLKDSFPYRDYVDDALIAEKESEPSRVKLYLSNNEAGHDMLADIKSCLDTLRGGIFGGLETEFLTLDEEDWSENWKQFFHPLKIGERILVRPEWEECENTDGRVVFTINPGMSFGTGSHETTRLCLEAIERCTSSGDTLLDLGCGSGILSITAVLLGAKCATAVDIDSNAVDIAKKNAEKNNVLANRYTALAGDITRDTSLCGMLAETPFDVVVANIVADVIIAIADIVPRFVRRGGIFIASGIITERLGEVASEIEKYFIIDETIDNNGWAAIIAHPKA